MLHAAQGHVLNRIATAQQAHVPNPPLFRTVSKLYERGGLWEFYKGLRWNMMSSCGKAATRWTLTGSLYHGVELFVPRSLRNCWFWNDAVAVGVSAAVIETTFVLTPLESFRTLEMTTTSQDHRKAVGDSTRHRGLFRTITAGWDRVFFRQLTSWVAYLVGYDVVKSWVIGKNPQEASADKRPSATLPQKVAVGVGTACVASLFTTPLDMLRTQAQMAGSSSVGGSLSSQYVHVVTSE